MDATHSQHHHDYEPSNADEPLKDHCGHLSAHIVGLLSDVSLKLNKDHLAVAFDFSEHFVSFIPLLYSKPPSV